MKRLLSIGFLGVYFCLTVGINVLVHSCGGFRTVDMMPVSAEDPCGCSDEMASDMCCTLVLKVFQLDDEQQASTIASISAPDYTFITYPLTMEIPQGEFSASPIPVDTSPPLRVAPTILNCSLLI